MRREYDFSKAKRGAVVQTPKTKERVTIHLDHEVLDWFRNEVERGDGGNYQNLINRALRLHVARSRKPASMIAMRFVAAHAVEIVRKGLHLKSGAEAPHSI